MAEMLDPLRVGAAGDAASLCAHLREVLGVRDLRVVHRRTIKPRVHRVAVAADGALSPLVLKRVDVAVAARCRAVDRWLASVGLDCIGCPVLGSLPGPAEEEVWMVFPDLGGHPVDAARPVPDEVSAVFAAVAALHRRCAGHPLLDECRDQGGDLAETFYDASVGEAIAAVEQVLADAVPCDGAARLRERLERLGVEQRERMALLAEWGGPATLLHGDLWPSNALVAATGRPRLIDWDHAGVGHPGYDVSAFLLRVPVTDRRWILDAHHAAMRGGPWTPWPDRVANAIFDTFERARLANCAIWAARAVFEGQPEWGLRRLEDIDRWLEELGPLVPE
jgi:hypothetical protein